MSLNHFTSQVYENKSFNPYFNSLKIKNGLNMDNSGLTNVSSINGVPIPSPLEFEINPVNIIFRPGLTPTPGSNVVENWADVITKSSKINVNNIINIYFDNTYGTCNIDQSYDFKGLAHFKSALPSIITINVNILDTYTISNIKSIDGIQIICKSVTTPALSFSDNFELELVNSASINNDPTTLVYSVTSLTQLYIYVSNLSYFRCSGNPAISLFHLTGFNVITIFSTNNPLNAIIFNDTISDDGTGQLFFNTDPTWSTNSVFPTFSGFTGTYVKGRSDNCYLVSYDDSKTPNLGTINVQDAIDYIKQNYIPKLSFFGDASDGDVTFSDGAIHSLTKDMYYNTLTLTNSSQVRPMGFRIFAITITGDGTGIIQYNGNDASGTAAGVGVTALPGISVGAIIQGGVGGAINTNGTGLSAIQVTLAGAGGRGADSDTKTGGTLGAITSKNAANYLFRNVYLYTGFVPAMTGTTFLTSQSGTGGAGGSAHTGGGGGSSGGLVYICAANIGNILLISAKGGNGGNASGATGGNGAGGGGGIVFLQYTKLLGGFNINTQITVTKGSPGTGGLNTNLTQADDGFIFTRQM